MQDNSYGSVTPALVGLAMKEMVRRAIKVIRDQRFVFDTKAKAHLDEDRQDLVTTADLEAQKVYLRAIQRCFPGFGILGEENELSVSCEIPGRQLLFTLDPLDGTRAFSRRQSAGVGTMIALMDGAKVEAAYVGDVMTREIYGYAPDSSVHRISEFEIGETLSKRESTVDRAYILLRLQPKDCSPAVQEIVGQFKGIDVEGGSIGISYARLWKGEVDALLTGPHFATPWDEAPVVGISRKLGYRFLKVSASGDLEEYEPVAPREISKLDHYTLVAGDQIVEQLLAV